MLNIKLTNNDIAAVRDIVQWNNGCSQARLHKRQRLGHSKTTISEIIALNH